jgi:hypothetical protein
MKHIVNNCEGSHSVMLNQLLYTTLKHVSRPRS